MHARFGKSKLIDCLHTHAMKYGKIFENHEKNRVSNASNVNPKYTGLAHERVSDELQSLHSAQPSSPPSCASPVDASCATLHGKQYLPTENGLQPTIDDKCGLCSSRNYTCATKWHAATQGTHVELKSHFGFFWI